MRLRRLFFSMAAFFGLPPASLCSATPLVNEGGKGWWRVWGIATGFALAMTVNLLYRNWGNIARIIDDWGII